MDWLIDFLYSIQSTCSLCWLLGLLDAHSRSLPSFFILSLIPSIPSTSYFPFFFLSFSLYISLLSFQSFPFFVPFSFFILHSFFSFFFLLSLFPYFPIYIFSSFPLSIYPFLHLSSIPSVFLSSFPIAFLLSLVSSFHLFFHFFLFFPSFSFSLLFPPIFPPSFLPSFFFTKTSKLMNNLTCRRYMWNKYLWNQIKFDNRGPYTPKDRSGACDWTFAKLQKNLAGHLPAIIVDSGSYVGLTNGTLSFKIIYSRDVFDWFNIPCNLAKLRESSWGSICPVLCPCPTTLLRIWVGVRNGIRTVVSNASERATGYVKQLNNKCNEPYSY